MKQHLILLAIISAIILIVITKSTIECNAKWADSYYTPVAGCMVQTQGTYVPEKNMMAIHWIEENYETE